MENNMLAVKHYVIVGNKKYIYKLFPLSGETTLVECVDANINQEFLNEDVPALLNDLPNLILAEKNYVEAKDTVIRFRVSANDKRMIEKVAAEKGYSSVSSYLKDVSIGRGVIDN